MAAAVTALSLALAGCGSPTTEASSTKQPDLNEEQRERELFSRPEPVTLKPGAVLRVRSLTTVSTKTNRSGDPFTATLAEPLTVEGKLIAPKGAMVRGVVAHSNPGGRVKGVASLSVRLTSIDTVAGPVDIVTNAVGRRARTTPKQDAMKIGIGSGLGAAIGAIASGGSGAAIGALAGGGAGTGLVLGTRGKPAVLPSETPMTFKLREPVTLTLINTEVKRTRS
jgi:hypothetical protein